MTTIVCVLRSGGDFAIEHVLRLQRQVAAHAPLSPFVCLTDLPRALDVCHIPAAPLAKKWPGWWAKMCAFLVPGPAIYMDLDVNVIGSLEPLCDAACSHDFIVLRNFWVADPHKINSSVMAWRGDMTPLFMAFARSPNSHMKAHSTPGHWGDQSFIAERLPEGTAYWQDLLPGMVMSFKRGVLAGEDMADCRVLCSHGKPRPWHRGGADAWLVAHGSDGA